MAAARAGGGGGGAGIKRKLVVAGTMTAAAAVVLLAEGASGFLVPSPSSAVHHTRRLLHVRLHAGEEAGGEGAPSRSSGSGSSTLLEGGAALPFAIDDPSLFRGRWTIKASNELNDAAAGFVALEIDASGSFRARGQATSGPPFLAPSLVRNGSFTLTPTPASSSSSSSQPPLAAAAATSAAPGALGAAGAAAGGGLEEGPSSSSAVVVEVAEVAGEVEFHTDEIKLEGLGLPPPMTPTRVHDLGGKRRRIAVQVRGLNELTLVFPDAGLFYVLERTTPGAQQEAGAGGGAPPLGVIIATNIVSLLSAGIVEAAKHEAAVLLDLIKK